MRLTRNVSLRDQVSAAVLDLLRSGEFPFGSRVTEEALAERFEVSRTPIREALARLAQQGILEKRAQGGYYIPDLDPQEITDLFAVRALLECAAIKDACATLSEKDLRELELAHQGQCDAGEKNSTRKFETNNDRFRKVLFGSLKNKSLKKFVDQFDAHIQFMRAIARFDNESIKPMMKRQKLVVEAIKARNCAAAEARWREYLDNSREWLLQAVAQSDERSRSTPAAAEA